MRLSLFQIFFLIFLFILFFSNSTLSQTLTNSFNTFLQTLQNYVSTRK